MFAPQVGLAAPRLVTSCVINNKSHGYINVQILYKGPARQGQGLHREAATVVLPMGGKFRAEERTMDHGSYQTRKEIDTIQITRANGQTQRLTAPFDGVNGIEQDWLFVVDDWQIHSVSKNQ